MSETDYKLYCIEHSDVVEHKNLLNLLRLKKKKLNADDFANWRDAKVIPKECCLSIYLTIPEQRRPNRGVCSRCGMRWIRSAGDLNKTRERNGP